MDDLITICIADDPPVKLTASRAILVANSKVFADMLSMPQGASVGASKDTVTVAEKADEIKPFLRLLNIAHEEGDPLEELEPDVWPTMATLGDKYDAPGVTLSALCKYWEYLQSDNAACLASCSRIAVSLGRQDLITPAAFSVLNEDAVTTILTPTEWSSQFEKFMERVEEFEQCFRDTTPSFPL
ncbi:hypothetical protein JCM3770_001906 [Rhodotorula araucariae]